jgi:ribosome-associated protein
LTQPLPNQPSAAPAPEAERAAPPAPTRARPLPAEEVLRRVLELCRERRADPIVALDVRELADYMDYLVIATGRSARQNRSIADHVVRELRPLGVRPLTRPGPDDGPWICLDFVDVVLHVFDAPTRAYYDLELLWGDAPHAE